MEINWYSKSISDVLDGLVSSQQGLDAKEADARLKQYGKNTLPEGKPDGLLIIFLRQFKSPLIYILLAAGVVVFSWEKRLIL